MVNKVEEKKCSKCNQIKRIDCFGVQITRGGKLRAQCNVCRSLYYYDDRAYFLEKQKKYAQANQMDIKQYQVDYRPIKNLKRRTDEKQIANRRKYENNKCKTDVNYKIRKNLRIRLNRALNGIVKSVSTLVLIGCSIEELKKRFETAFYTNPKTGEMMSWENYGFYGWHIDHIVPLSSFDLTDPEQLKKACHYTNLQPLWWFENLSKNDR